MKDCNAAYEAFQAAEAKLREALAKRSDKEKAQGYAQEALDTATAEVEAAAAEAQAAANESKAAYANYADCVTS